MIEVKRVVRQNNVAKEVTISTGAIEMSYVLVDGKPKEIARIGLDKQILDDQSLIISPADYRQAIRTVNAILREKRRKAR